MDVRVATAEDLDALGALYESAWGDGEDEWPAPGWEDVAQAVATRVNAGRVLLAEHDGVIVGFADVEQPTASSARVEALHVRDAALAHDATQALLGALIRRLRPDGVTHLEVDVAGAGDPAAATFARLGFVPRAQRLGVALDVLERDLERRPRGESFGSVHVQTDDLTAVEKGVRRFIPLLRGRSEGSVVSPPRNGWIAVYDELCDRDPSALKRLARELSDRLGVPTIAFGVEEGAVARYLIYDRGRLLDEYLSVQEYYGPLPSGEVVALGANPTLVERLTGADRRAVREAAVHARTPDELPPPVEIVAALARAMRIEGADHGYARATEIPGAIQTS